MPITPDTLSVLVDSITIPENRQRSDAPDIEPLAKSISQRGQIHPIILMGTPRASVLVAGFRRLMAQKLLGSTHILARFVENVPPNELRAIELEENIKRRDLSWQDEARAVREYHEAQLALDSSWSQTSTAVALGLSASSVSKQIAVAVSLSVEPALAQQPSVNSAYNEIQRKASRAIDDELLLFQETETPKAPPAEPSAEAPGEDVQRPSLPLPPPPALNREFYYLTCSDFLTHTYYPRRANFIHCDFPYGLDMGENPLQGTNPTFSRYDDSQELYFKLLSHFLSNIDTFAQPKCHIMFWFSMNYYSYTVQRFSEVGFYVNPFPLIWMKSDLRGLLPDSRRYGRRVYETALVLSRGDRFILEPIANAISLPSEKAEAQHLSEKPESVLKHFFRLFIDEDTVVLDPTCGSGTALSAATALGARAVMGLDIDLNHITTTERRIQRAQAISTLTGDLL